MKVSVVVVVVSGDCTNGCNLTVKPGRQLKVDSYNCTGAAVTAVGCQPHGTLQMVNWPVTIDTINDYIHKRNGQKSRSELGELLLGGPKARNRRHIQYFIIGAA